jgi:hypothetical protein
VVRIFFFGVKKSGERHGKFYVSASALVFRLQEAEVSRNKSRDFKSRCEVEDSFTAFGLSAMGVDGLTFLQLFSYRESDTCGSSPTAALH